MAGPADQERYWPDIARLLAYPAVGPLPAGAIASNLGAPAGSLDALLAALVQEERLVRMSDGRFALPIPARRD
jgi:hypothetical protein